MTSESVILDALAGHRIELPVLGVRQLRDPVQGVRPARRPARPVREGRRRRRGPSLHRRRADGRAAHPVGQGRRTTRDLARHAADCGVALGTINSNTFQDDDYMLGSVCHPDPRVRQKAIDHLLECVDIMDATGLARPQAVVRRRHELPGPGRHPRPPGPPGGGARDGLRAPRRRPADGARVQAVRARVLHDRRPRLGHGARPLPAAGRAGARRRRHRPPRARHEHRVHRRVAAAGREARRVRLQLALLRRRRPHGRRGRPVPAVPDHARGREGRRPAPRGAASRSCSTSATTSSPRSPGRSGR